MVALDLITDEVPPLKLSEKCTKALHWMEEFRVNHIPVVDGNEYMGLISDDNIFDLENPEVSIEKSKLILPVPHVKSDQHIYDVMKAISDLQLTLVPVLDNDNNYLGCITVPHLMELVVNTASINEPGGIIVLEMAQNDYSLTEIAQIVEGNDSKILSSYITSASDSTSMEVTIKVNTKDLGGILQTFNRYDYRISASYSEDRFKEDVKLRYDALMKYLNI
ncbi:MAG: CBS domain-containing protein [Crocinitomicaceae bacterium]|nr:CBS domain-containing protein [Crocinitomicaceae bacterium]